ncbi:COG1470 family protein [Jidongwangia harbinensis]|uniref:COG1470 family protein n=1 Tax=Jidongwangia harbinensis TaxID=2878561 RepID=UPI001CDA0856|nr:hypothetical protein [Jidongwangia harbinensis]MCA2211769.1 hypothetical protein [Jidongwangia harbinensis]
MTLPLRVTVAPERADAAPGDALTFDVTVKNASDIVEHYGVEFLGLPNGATVRAEPEVAKLRPSESATLTVRVQLPVQPPAPAGTYVVGALVRSPYRQDVSRCVEVPVELASVQEITVRATPEVVTGGRAGRYTVEVANGGNSPVRLYLAATDPERRVTTTFEPPSVDLPPGTSAQSLLTVQAPLPWNREQQRQLTLTATPDLPGAAAGTGTATFVQRPRFASKFAKVAGIAAAVVVLAAAVAVPALLAARGDDEPDPAPVAAPAVSGPAVGGAPSAAAPTAEASSPAAQPGASANQPPPPEAGGASSAAATQQPPPEGGGDVEARVIDLTAPGDGVLASDAFRDQGFLVSADPRAVAVPGCEGATAVSVVTEADRRFLTSSTPDNAADCHNVSVLIDFLQGTPAGAVTLSPVTKDVLTMEVAYGNLSRSIEPTLKVSAEVAKERGGVDWVQVRPRSQDGAATPPVALTSLSIAPLA